MLSRVFQSLWTSTRWVLTPEVSDSLVIFTKPPQLEPKINVFSDATLNEAAQILRLLHIEELRELQTKINEAIVAVQAIIADPKTDHRLGKVGRWEDEEYLPLDTGLFFVCYSMKSDCLSWEKLEKHILKFCASCWSVASFCWTFRSDLSFQLKFLHCGCVVKIQKHQNKLCFLMWLLRRKTIWI